MNNYFIIGKVNSGKSFLFNLFSKSHKTISNPKENTTVDIIKKKISFDNYEYNIYDTPGFYKIKDFSILLRKIQDLKLKNFSVLPGSELKLLKGLELGCSGIITATCNVTAQLSRKVYDDFLLNNEQTYNQKLCEVRKVFDKNNFISGLHTFYSKEDEAFKNILPPLRLLNQKEEKKLMQDLKDLNFKISTSMAA